jgi:nucleotide-binding universal stress UspA family protein
VIGVFGLHHLGRIRSLGSVSRRIVESSTIPVVLVP